MQAAGGSGLPDRGRLEARGAREIDPSRTSVNAAPLVGAAPVGVESCSAPGAAAARSLRQTLPEGVQGKSPRDPPRSASTAVGRRGTPQGALVVHRRFRELGHGGERDLPRRGAEPRARGARRGADGRGPVRGRGLDPSGSAAARMRGVCERSESGRVSDPQGDAGRHPASRARIGRGASESRPRDQGGRSAGAGGAVPARPRRCDADRLSVGADRAVRGAELRCRDSVDALFMAMQEESAQTSVTDERSARRRRYATSRVRDLRTRGRQGRTGRNRDAGKGDVCLLRSGASTRARPGATGGTARGRGCHLRQAGAAHRRGVAVSRGHAQAGREGTTVPASNGTGLPDSKQGKQPRRRNPRQMGT